MKKLLSLVVLLVATLGCDAITAHVDVAARAGSQELSATRLAELMSGGNLPPRRDLALVVSNLWVNYQLLGYAAARNDTLTDTKLVDEAMWAQIAQRRSQKFSQVLEKSFPVPDAAASERAYNAGELLAAQHILIPADQTLLQPRQLDSARRVANAVRRQVTAENFAAMAKRHSGDPGSKDNGGEYVFPRGQMVAEFEQGTLALKPGEISEPIQSRFGFHIIRRETYAEAKPRFDTMYQSYYRARAESSYLATLASRQNVQVKPGAAKVVRDIAEDLDRYREDRTVLVTSRAMDFRAGKVALWIAAMPPQMQARQQIRQAADSSINEFLRNLMQNELILHAADSAKVTVDSQELAGIRGAFHGSLANSLAGLNLTPARLGDAGASIADRERIAAQRVNEYVEKLLKNEVQFVDVAEPVALALRRRFDSRVVSEGVDRAVSQIASMKAKADSARDAALPKSIVPVPGAGAPADVPAGGTDSGKARAARRP